MRRPGRAGNVGAAGAAPVAALPPIGVGGGRDRRPRAGRGPERLPERRGPGDDRRRQRGRRDGIADVADPVVLGVRDDDRTSGELRDGLRAVQLRRARRAAVPAVAGVPGPGERRDRAVRRDAAYRVVRAVGDEEAAVARRPDVVRVVQLGGGRRAAVAAVAGDAVAGHRGDRPVRPDAPDPLVADVVDEEAAVGERRDPERDVQLRRRGRSSVAAKPWTPVPATVEIVPSGHTRRTR